MSDNFYGVTVVDIDTVMARVEELPPRAAAWVDRQLEVQGDVYFDDASLNSLVDEAAGLDADVLEDADLPSLSLTPDARWAQIRERIAARIPEYQGESGGREAQLASLGFEGEDDVSRHPGWYTEYRDRADIADRASEADAEGRVLDENGDPMNGTWGWVMDHATGYLLFFPESELVLQYSDGTRSKPMTRLAGLTELQRAKATDPGVVVVRTHHTTPVAGMPVTGAGLMTLQDGWIVDITDESGHYQPTASNQYEAMETMAEQGVSFQRPVAAEHSPDGEAGYRDARVHLTGSGAGTGGRPTGKAEWIDEMHDENPYVPVDELTLSAQQFDQTQGNEVQARLKAGLNEEFRRTRAGELRRQAGDAPEPVAQTVDSGVYTTVEALGSPVSAPTTGSGGVVYNTEVVPPTASTVVTDLGYVDGSTAAPSTAAPANSLGEGFTYDPQRQLFQQQDTGSYFSADGELVYQWDPQQERYYDHTTQTWL